MKRLGLLSTLNRNIFLVFFFVTFMCIGAFFYNKPVSASVPAAAFVWKTTTMTSPKGVAVSPYDGNVYIATSATSGNLIQEWTSAGVLVHTWGAYGTGVGQLKGASDIAIDSSGNIYVVEYGNHRIQKFDSSHTSQWTVGGTSSGSGNSQFSYPEGIGVDNAGNVYVADSWNNRVQIFNSTTGAYISQFATGGVRHFNMPADVALDASGNIYVADTYNHVIQKFNSSRVFISEFGTNGNGIGEFSYPRGIAIDSTGNIYIADSSNNRIQKFTSSFEFYNPIGSYGTGNGYFSYPYKIALGSDTTFYVADSNNSRIQKFDFSGFNYQVSNLTASLNVLDSFGSNIELGERIGVNNASAVLRLQTSTGIVLSDVTVDMTADRDWTSINGDSDRTTGKAFVSSLIGAPGVSASHTLYVPIPAGKTSESVIICPDATSLVDVTSVCTNGIERGVGTFTESWGAITITKEGISGYGYWKITGMKGSGGMAYDLVLFTGLGAGTVGDPYQITTCVELQEMKNNLAAYFSIMNSIDCSATSGWNGGIGFIPIGADGNTPFTGHLIGNASYTISGLYINQANTSPPSGLFGFTSGAEISEVHLINLSIVLSDSEGTVGGLVAHMIDGSIDHSSVEGSISETVSDYIEYVGGMIGMTEGTTHITDSSTNVNIALFNDVYESGGFIGMSTGTTLIEDCSASGNFSAGIDSYANGGFIGDMEGNSTILRSSASGSVGVSLNAAVREGDSYDNGGFVGGMGWVANRYPGTRLISDSYATGDVYSEGENNYDLGGFVGCLYDGGTITNSYATGDVTGELKNIAVGGFIGLTRNRYGYADPVITSSYATGNISTNFDSSDIGGFIGDHRDGSIESSHATGNIILGSANNESEFGFGAGGFVGYMDHSAATSSSIKYSYSTGSIDSYGEAVGLGGFLGYSNSNNSLIDECYSLGSYVKGAYEVGGFVGFSIGSSNLIRNSYTRTDVTSRYYDKTDPTGAGAKTGGFVGYQGDIIQNSYSTGTGEGITNLIRGVNTTLTGTIDDYVTSMTVSNASGIIPGGYLEIDVYTGSLFSTTLSESSGSYVNHIHVVDASGFTAGDTITIGGLSNYVNPCVIGSIDGTTINFASGSMTNRNYSAGATVAIAAATEIEDVLVGSVNGNVLTITRAMGYTYSDIHPAGSVVHSFEINPITGGLGGFSGYSAGGTITSSYWDMEASGLDSSYGGTGLTTSQLKTQSNLTGWDFDTVWSIYSGNNDGYPALDQIIWTNYDCSGLCESGATCNQYGNPPQGKMWACRYNGSAYKCLFDDINAGGSSCYLNCSSGWQSCGCNQSACESACTAEHANDGYGHFTHTDICDGCGQLFTCGCDNIAPTGTPTPTPTISPTPPIVRPINDDFVNAIDIGNNAVINASNVNATTEVGEYTDSAYFSQTVWWKLHAASVYSLTVSLCGSDYDTYLSVGTGTAVDNYTPVAENDDSCNVQSVVTFNTVEGTDYYIQVSGYGENVGNIVLTITGMPYEAPMGTPTPTPTPVPSLCESSYFCGGTIYTVDGGDGYTYQTDDSDCATSSVCDYSYSPNSSGYLQHCGANDGCDCWWQLPACSADRGESATPTPTPMPIPTLTFYVSDTLTRLKVGVNSDHTITFNTINGLTESSNTIEINMADWDILNLTVSDLRLSTDNTILSLDDTPGVNTWGVTFEAGVITLTAPTTGSGYISAGSSITLKIGVVASGINQPVNPESVGSYRIFVTNNTPSGAEAGEASIPIVDSDQVDITGYVNAFMSFDIDTGTNDEVDCASNECKIHGGTGAAPGDNYTVDLGELKSTVVNKSKSDEVMHSDGISGVINSIYFDLSTNANGGVVVTVTSATNNGLVGPSGSNITPVTDGNTIAANSGKYGFNVADSSSIAGESVVTNSSCNVVDLTHYCGSTTTPKQVFNTTGSPIDTARVRMDIAAAAAYTNTPGAYTDILTFIATATF